ncbi:hypothetical protein SAFG77S_01005 [Streptomyces afghaniensis]
MGINQWREETEWPLSRAVDTDFHLRADGRLTQEPPSTAERADEFTYDPMDPVPTTGGALLMSDEFRAGPLDQTAVEGREDVLVFTTAPLTEAVEVTWARPGGALRRHGRALDRLGGTPVRR